MEAVCTQYLFCHSNQAAVLQTPSVCRKILSLESAKLTTKEKCWQSDLLPRETSFFISSFSNLATILATGIVVRHCNIWFHHEKQSLAAGTTKKKYVTHALTASAIGAASKSKGKMPLLPVFSGMCGVDGMKRFAMVRVAEVTWFASFSIRCSSTSCGSRHSLLFFFHLWPQTTASTVVLNTTSVSSASSQQSPCRFNQRTSKLPSSARTLVLHLPSQSSLFPAESLPAMATRLDFRIHFCDTEENRMNKYKRFCHRVGCTCCWSFVNSSLAKRLGFRLWNEFIMSGTKHNRLRLQKNTWSWGVGMPRESRYFWLRAILAARYLSYEQSDSALSFESVMLQISRNDTENRIETPTYVAER